MRPGLYLHVPFCRSICPYCDFAVTTGRPMDREGFVESLVSEMRLWDLAGWGFDTVYVGGGTPSSLEPDQLGRILGATGAPGARVFLEANPEDVDSDRARRWRDLGAATLSLGVQSFDPAELRFLGRRHRAPDAIRSVETARDAGFGTVSLDLIYGLPGETQDAWRKNLEAALALSPDHLSCYQLTVEPGTFLGRKRARGELAELPEEERADLFLFTHRYLADAGYPAYEVSNFAASPEHRSSHNQKYWRHVPYLGLGPSAHSFDGARRWWNHRALGDYEAAVGRSERPIAGEETLTAMELALEAVLLGLRTADGIDLALFRERHGFDLVEANRDLVARETSAGRMRVEGGRLWLALEGLAIADGLAATFELSPVEAR
ncbi:MAG: radical SAM family heme chaperone HemW [Planctomycetes bacterium]|nr:radical SAM family heme chaperone HemW [Planctomycetota bacterium]